MPGTSNFPTSIDTFPTISPETLRDEAGKSLSEMTNNASAALVALQTKVGVDDSADDASIDKRLAMAASDAAAALGGLRGINAQSGTAYTPALTDAGKNIRCSNAAAITVTIPPASSVAFPANTVLYISQGGAGAVSVAAGGAGEGR